MKERSMIILTLVAVVIMVLGAYALYQVRYGQISGEGNELARVNFTNQTVYLFGYSKNSETFEERLHLSTSNVILITKVDDLSKLTGKFILFIDGECFKNSHDYSINATANGVRSLIFNGIPTVLFNRSSDFFAFSVGDRVDFGSIDQSHISIVNGVKFYPNNNSSVAWSYGSKDVYFDQTITASYNWAEQHLSDQPPS